MSSKFEKSQVHQSRVAKKLVTTKRVASEIIQSEPKRTLVQTSSRPLNTPKLTPHSQSQVHQSKAVKKLAPTKRNNKLGHKKLMQKIKTAYKATELKKKEIKSTSSFEAELVASHSKTKAHNPSPPPSEMNPPISEMNPPTSERNDEDQEAQKESGRQLRSSNMKEIRN